MEHKPSLWVVVIFLLVGAAHLATDAGAEKKPKTDVRGEAGAARAAGGKRDSTSVEYLLSLLARGDGQQFEKLLPSLRHPGPEAGCVEPCWEIRSLLVMIPDPMNASLALEADRALEAVRLAAATGGFLLDRTVLPWKGLGKAALPEDGDARDRPGLLLFRQEDSDGQKRELLLVYLIPDAPDSGIRAPAFRQALTSVMGLLPHPPGLVRVVGPVYSGSIVSLRSVLAAAMAPGGGAGRAAFEIVSGTTSLTTLWEQLQKGLPDASRVSFVSLADVDQLELLQRYLARKHVEPEHVALLMESGTAFGEGLSRHTMQRYSFPRDLSLLRALYQKDASLYSGLFSRKTSQDGVPGLQLAAGDADVTNLPIFSTDHTPVSQHMSIRHLGARLRHAGARYAGVIASDPLDTLFVGRLIQKECPNVRLFVMGSDTLFDSDISTDSFRGILTLTVQPPGPLAGKPELASLGAYGTYSACLRQLGLSRVEKLPVWLAVEGQGGEWPIEQLFPGTWLSAEKHGLPRDVLDQDSLRGIPMLRGMAFPLAFVLCLTFWPLAAFLYNQRQTGFNAVSGIAPYCSLYASSFLPARRVWLLALLATGAGACWPIVRGMFAILTARGSNAGQERLWVLLSLIVLMVLAGMVWGVVQLVFFHRGPDLRAAARDPAAFRRVTKLGSGWRLWLGMRTFPHLAYLLPALVGLIAGFAADTRAHLPETLAELARHADLTNGVSPITPVVLMMLGLHYAVWVHLRRDYLQSEAQPLLPNPTVSEPADALPSSLSRAAETVISAISVVTYGRVSVVLAVGVAVTIGVIGLHVDNLEPDSTGWEFMTIAAVMLWVYEIGLVQFAWLWSRLRRLLAILDTHPIREAFSRLPDRASWYLIWSPSSVRPRYASLPPARDYLSVLQHRRAISAAVAEPIIAGAGRLLEEVHRRGAAPADEFAVLQKQLASLTGELASGDLARYWAANRLQGYSPAETAKPPSDRSNLQLQEELVALQYSVFVRYAVYQLRNLLGLLAVGLTIMILSVNVYPFHPAQWLSRLALVAFVVCASVVLSVFYQMERNPVLSRLSGSTPDKLDAVFYWRLLQFGIVPATTVAATFFKPLGDLLAQLARLLPALPK